MANVTKSRWTYNGVTKEAWCVDFTDERGKRHRWVPKSGLKSDAEAFKRSAERIRSHTDLHETHARTNALLAELSPELREGCSSLERLPS